MWDAKLYNRFERERIQPSIDLAARIDKENCNRIIDIGCGSGMSTFALRNKYPKAEIIGVDLSKNMLEKAQELLPNVKFIQRDCSESLEDLGKFDIVFSNAFLQWLPDQKAFIKNSTMLLDGNSVIAIQIPGYEELPIAGIIRETAAEFDKKNKIFNAMSSVCTNYAISEYYDMFSEYYSDIEVWQTNYIHQMENSDSIVEFVKSTALIPYMECLNSQQKEEFISLLKEKTSRVYRKNKNGKVLFPFHRYFFICKL